MLGNTHNLPHSKDHHELTSWVLFAICIKNIVTINTSTNRQSGTNVLSTNFTQQTNKSQSSNNSAFHLLFSNTVRNSLEKGIMKFLIININLSHLWSNLQNKITFIMQFHHINTCASTCMCFTITQERQ